MNNQRIVLVTRKTRLEGLIERFNTREQARFYIEHSGGDFDLFVREHETYQMALEALKNGLHRLAKMQVIERGFLPNYLFNAGDVVVTIGIDGLVVNTAKYLDGQPLLAVNPDPAHIDGILLPFRVEQAVEAARRVLGGDYRARHISMAEASLNDGQRLRAFNDLFIGVRSHVSARYRIQAGEQAENHSSSGLIVSTGVGATGWLSSMFNMAEGLLRGFGQAGGGLPRPDLTWEAERLIYVVREPFISKTSGASLVCGWITPDTPLILESQTAEGGVIFSDGVETDFLSFNAGSQAVIRLAQQKTCLVV